MRGRAERKPHEGNSGWRSLNRDQEEIMYPQKDEHLPKNSVKLPSILGNRFWLACVRLQKVRDKYQEKVLPALEMAILDLKYAVGNQAL